MLSGKYVAGATVDDDGDGVADRWVDGDEQALTSMLNTTPLQYQVGKMEPQNAMRVWRLATAAERQQLGDILGPINGRDNWEQIVKFMAGLKPPLYQSVAAFLFGILWLRTRNLLLVILVHAATDLLSNAPDLFASFGLSGAV